MAQNITVNQLANMQMYTNTIQLSVCPTASSASIIQTQDDLPVNRMSIRQFPFNV